MEFRNHEVVVIRGVGRAQADIPNSVLLPLQVEFISGTVNSPDFVGGVNINSTANSSDKPLVSDALNWTGEWFGAAVGERGGALFADHFGLCHLHWTVFDEGEHSTIVAGSTIRGVLRVLELLGKKPSPRVDIALPTLVSTVNHFHSRFARNSYASNVKVLENDEWLVFSSEGWYVGKRPEFAHSGSYESLIDAGIERACQMLRSSTSNSRENVFSLSGGKDSRAAMALVAASGTTKEFAVHSNRPAGFQNASAEIWQSDLRIASKIVDKFGLNWAVNNEGNAKRLSFIESVSHWQDSRSGINFELGPVKSVNYGRNRTMLTGHGGELLRDYWGKTYLNGFPGWQKHAELKNNTSINDLDLLFRTILPIWNLEPNWYEKSLNAYLSAFHGDTNAEAELNRFFTAYRGRAHAGYLEMSRSLGNLEIVPLMQPEFLAASRLLSQEDKYSGRVLFDIVERSTPELNALEFESKPYPESYATRGNSNFWQDASVERATERFLEQRTSARNTLVVDNSEPDYSFHESSVLRIAESLDAISSAIDGPLFDSLIDRVARHAQFNETACRRVMVSLESLRDVIEVPSVSVDVREYQFQTKKVSQWSLPSDKWRFQDTIPTYSLDFTNKWEEIDLTQVTSTLHVESDLLHLELDNVPEECEIAVYFFADNKRFHSTTYEKDVHELHVQLPPNTKVARCTVFLRWAGVPSAQRIIENGTTTRQS